MSRTNSALRGRVIFVVGARRSGTNWLQRVLAAHPRVTAVPSETYIFSHGLRPLVERFHHGAMSSARTGTVYAERQPLLDAMRDLCDVVFAGLMRGLSPQAEWIVERTPDHVRHLDLIGDVYPDAKIVHIIRDGRDVVRSLLRQEWGPSDVRKAALEWRESVEAAQGAAPVLPGYQEVRYEEMLADPAAYIRRLFPALEIAADERDLESVLVEASVGYNIDASSPRIDAGKWRTDLDARHVAVIDQVAGDLLVRLGYEPSSTTAGEGRRQPRSRRTLRQRASALRGERSVRPLDIGQRVLDLFLQAAATDPRRIEELLTPHARFRIVDGGVQLDSRGPAARARFIEAVASDEALRRTQRVGFIHPSVPTVAFVGEFETDGIRHPRVFVLDVKNGAIERIAYYRFPDAAADQHAER